MSTPQSQFDISDIAEPPPSQPARARSPAPSQPAAVNPQLDSFVNDVITEASRRTGYTYRLGSGVRSPEEQAQKVAQGYSKTYDSKHLTGSARDVLAFDSTGNYIRDGAHPAYQALGDVYREKAATAPVPVKWGGDFKSFHDPGHFELGAASTSTVPKFDISDIAEPESKFDISDIAEPADDEVVSINASRSDTQLPPSLSAPQSQPIDVQTEAGRRARDAYRAAESDPRARLEVSVPLGLGDPSKESADSLMQRAIIYWADSKGIPAEFAREWIGRNAPQGYSMHDVRGDELQSAADAMTPDAYDEKNHAVRVRLPLAHIARMERDYNESKSVLQRTSDWATSDEESPGEKMLDVVRPAGQAAGYVLDKAGRVIGALTAAEWSRLRGGGMGSQAGVEIDPKGAAAALQVLEGGEAPECARNPIGEAARNSQTLAQINPHLPALVGAAGDLVDPFSLVPIEGVGELAEGGRLGRAVEGVGDAARGAGVLERGFVEARPLGIAAAREANVAEMEGRLGRVLEVTRKVRAGEELTPEETALAEEVRSKYAPQQQQSAPDPASLEYARERQRFYAEEAASAKDPIAKAAAQANADAYAADVARLEGRELHHSELQPRTEGGQFDGPPRSLPSRVLDTVSDIVNAPKSIKSSLALHGPFRQGILQSAAHPSFLKEAIANQVKAFASEDAFQDFARSIIERPDYQEMKDAGLFLPSVYDAEGTAGAGTLMRDERFSSGLADKVPGVRRSERAYLAAMDSLRTHAWDLYMADLTRDGAQPGGETLSALADWINVSTGRGRVPILDRYEMGRKVVAALNNGFWSPRAMASRFNVLSPYSLAADLSNPATRPVALLRVRDSMRALTSLGATLGLLSLAPGVRVGLDPRRSDWGKVSLGDTHFDALDGVPASARFAAKLARSFALRAGGRRLSEFQSPAYIVEDFLRRRLSPSGQVAADYATGRTLEGGKPTAGGEAREALAPFVLDDLYQAWLDTGGSSLGDALDGNKNFKMGFKGLPKALPSAFGVPSSEYRERARRSGRYGAAANEVGGGEGP